MTLARALVEVVLMGVACGLLGALAVPRGLTFVAESLSHSLLLGAAVALLLGAPLLGGAFVGAIAAALAIAALARRTDVGADVAVGVVFTGFLALSVMLLAAHGRSEDLEALLFGDLFSLHAGELAAGAVVTGLLAAAVAAFGKQLVAIGFDRGFADAAGLRPGQADAVTLVALAAALTVALRGVGSLLVLSLLVAPAASARLMARRSTTMLWLAPVIGVAVGVAGTVPAYYASLEPGPLIALTGLGVVAAALVLTSE
jgi:ABC-type Mn2+/Zn2+ transport system permease subunit